MRLLTVALLIASFPAGLLFGCAAGGPGAGTDLDGASPDTVGAAAWERLFFDLYSELTAELENAAGGRTGDPVILEVEAMVAAAEELYLEGRIELAVRMLSEARLMLDSRSR